MEPRPVVLVGHYAPDGRVERIDVVEAPALSLISPGMLAEMDPRYRDADDPDVLVLAPDVRYLVGAEYGFHGERLLHRIP